MKNNSLRTVDAVEREREREREREVFFTRQEFFERICLY